MLAPFISQNIRGTPTTREATTIPVAMPEAVRDQTNHGAIAATEYRRSSITTLIAPGVGTMTLFLSLRVEKMDGSPINNMSAGRINHFDQSTTAQGPAIQAISSDKNRRLEDAIVSYG
jgi:hypothetical protein